MYGAYITRSDFTYHVSGKKRHLHMFQMMNGQITDRGSVTKMRQQTLPYVNQKVACPMFSSNLFSI